MQEGMDGWMYGGIEGGIRHLLRESKAFQVGRKQKKGGGGGGGVMCVTSMLPCCEAAIVYSQ